LRHHQKTIILNDLDPTIAGIWEWLINVSKEDIQNLPNDINDLNDIDEPARSLIGFWFNKGSVAPASSPSAWMRSGKWPNQFWGQNIKQRIVDQLESIRYWKISNKSYEELDNQEATWFIDPPYQKQGKHYVKGNDINYEALAEWVGERKGQVIVCEQKGADWLPFEPFRSLKSLKSRHSSEVLFYMLNTDMNLPIS
jgi:hypothetical protein